MGSFITREYSIVGTSWSSQFLHFWLDLGVDLLPVQPGSKHLVCGFGPYLQRVTTIEAANFWFIERRCNVAIVTGGVSGLVCVDFDDQSAFDRWLAGPGRDVHTLTESTQSGAHVFFAVDQAQGLVSQVIVKGQVELKACGGFVVVAPFVVNGFRYCVLTDCYPEKIDMVRLSCLLGHDFSPTKQKQSIPKSKPLLRGASVVKRIKQAFDLTELVNELLAARGLPELRKTGSTLSARCPFHSDRNPSFWVDPERGFYMCKSCGARGDVVNIYAALHGLDVKEAIKQMRLQVVDL